MVAVHVCSFRFGVIMNKPVRVELHLHTSVSKDSLVQPEKLLKRCEKLGIDRIAVTDHNAIENALMLKALAPEHVIVGEEIETTQGELLGYFVKECVPAGLEPMEAIRSLRAQGAVISVAHPFDSHRGAYWEEKTLLDLIPHIDAIEIFNARCWSDSPNRQAALFAQDHDLLKTVGSDAHTLWELGKATLIMQDFDDAEGFKSALKDAQAITQRSPWFVHLFSRYAVLNKKIREVFK